MEFGEKVATFEFCAKMSLPWHLGGDIAKRQNIQNVHKKQKVL